MNLAARESVSIHGRMRLTVVDADGNVTDERHGDNVICTTGFTVISSALVWSGIQDQSANTGVTTGTFLTPLYGAVGSGAGVPAKADSQLFTELGRVVVGAGGATPATSTIASATTWLFYFPSPVSTWTVTEAGMFANATTTANSGVMIDHWAFSPTVSVPTTNTLILEVSLQFGP
jgi:hypothetical protein